MGPAVWQLAWLGLVTNHSIINKNFSISIYTITKLFFLIPRVIFFSRIENFNSIIINKNKNHNKQHLLYTYNTHTPSLTTYNNLYLQFRATITYNYTTNYSFLKPHKNFLNHINTFHLTLNHNNWIKIFYSWKYITSWNRKK